MKVFAINETEWIAAETQEEALEFEGYEDISEVDSIEEIKESEWDEPMECYQRNCEDEDEPIEKSIRELIGLQTEFPCKIMTEVD